MKKLIILFLAGIMFGGCENTKYDAKVHLPSKQYDYVYVDSSRFTLSAMVYVPIYSHIYMQNGTRVTNLAATLSLRSTNFTDSIYVSKVDYYNSQGKLIRKYLDSMLLLKPMHSVEFVVEEQESEGGAGANFIVEWHGLKTVSDPLVEAVMLGTYNNMGISFKTDGIKVQSHP